MTTTLGPRRAFAGEVIRRTADDFGLVKFDGPYDGGKEPDVGFFTHEHILTRGSSRAFKVGRRVHGSAAKFGETYKILSMEAD